MIFFTQMFTSFRRNFSLRSVYSLCHSYLFFIFGALVLCTVLDLNLLQSTAHCVDSQDSSPSSSVQHGGSSSQPEAPLRIPLTSNPMDDPVAFPVHWKNLVLDVQTGYVWDGKYGSHTIPMVTLEFLPHIDKIPEEAASFRIYRPPASPYDLTNIKLDSLKTISWQGEPRYVLEDHKNGVVLLINQDPKTLPFTVPPTKSSWGWTLPVDRYTLPLIGGGLLWAVFDTALLSATVYSAYVVFKTKYGL